MDPRFGQIASSGVLGDVNINRAVPSPASTHPVNAPVAPYDPTVGEHLRSCISDMQARIKEMENHYHAARQLGMLDQKLRTVREILGW